MKGCLGQGWFSCVLRTPGQCGTPVFGGPDPTPAPGRGAQPRCRCGAAPAPPQECCALPPHPLSASSSRKAALPMVSPHLEGGFGISHGSAASLPQECGQGRKAVLGGGSAQRGAQAGIMESSVLGVQWGGTAPRLPVTGEGAELCPLLAPAASLGEMGREIPGEGWQSKDCPSPGSTQSPAALRAPRAGTAQTLAVRMALPPPAL